MGGGVLAVGDNVQLLVYRPLGSLHRIRMERIHFFLVGRRGRRLVSPLLCFASSLYMLRELSVFERNPEICPNLGSPSSFTFVGNRNESLFRLLEATLFLRGEASV